MRRECCCPTSSYGIYIPHLEQPCTLPASILGILSLSKLWMWSIFELFKEQAINCWQGWNNKHSFAKKKIIYILIVLSSSSDFGCNWVKAGTKHNAIEEKLEVIEEQFDLDEEDEITMRVFGKNELSEVKYISSLHSMWQIIQIWRHQS